MAVTTQDLALQVRRRIGDWGALSFELSVVMAVGAAVVQADTMQLDYIRAGHIVCIDVEDVEVIEPLGNPITVLRSRRGTTAAEHAIGALALVEPRFTNQEIVEALNEALRVFSGLVPKLTTDVSLTTATGVEEYTLPAAVFEVEKVELETGTEGLYRPFRTYEVSYSTGKLRMLGRVPTGRTIRLGYLAAHADLTWATADVVVPTRYHGFLIDYAHGELLLREAMEKATVVASATGDSTSVRESLIAAQTMKLTAQSKLDAIRPASRVVNLRDKRVYRL